jgi:hypothetical protein
MHLHPRFKNRSEILSYLGAVKQPPPKVRDLAALRLEEPTRMGSRLRGLPQLTRSPEYYSQL